MKKTIDEVDLNNEKELNDYLLNEIINKINDLDLTAIEDQINETRESSQNYVLDIRSEIINHAKNMNFGREIDPESPRELKDEETYLDHQINRVISDFKLTHGIKIKNVESILKYARKINDELIVIDDDVDDINLARHLPQFRNEPTYIGYNAGNYVERVCTKKEYMEFNEDCETPKDLDKAKDIIKRYHNKEFEDVDLYNRNNPTNLASMADGNNNNDVDVVGMDIDDEDDSADETLRSIIDEHLNDNFIHFTSIKTWGDYFRFCGYNSINSLDESFLDSVYDVIDIVLEGMSSYNQYEDAEGFICKFVDGELNDQELTIFTSDILTLVTDQNENNVIDSLEDDDDVAYDIFILHNMLLDITGAKSIFDCRKCISSGFTVCEKCIEHKEINHTNNTSIVTYSSKSESELKDFNDIRKRLREIDPYEDDCYDELMDIWNKTEEINKYNENRNFNRDDDEEIEDSKTLKKKSRIDFDIKENPLQEIRFEQKQTDLLLDKKHFADLVNEILQDFGMNVNIEIDDEAIKMLQNASEDYLIGIFEDSNLATIHASKTYISPRDIQIARRIRKEYR